VVFHGRGIQRKERISKIRDKRNSRHIFVYIFFKIKKQK
jgi:hypothetical protein